MNPRKYAALARADVKARFAAGDLTPAEYEQEMADIDGDLYFAERFDAMGDNDE